MLDASDIFSNVYVMQKVTFETSKHNVRSI